MARGISKAETKRSGEVKDGKSRRPKQRVSDTADWEGIAGDLLQKAIGRITACGGAIRFGYTTDGGAYALGIYDGDERYTEYFRTGEECESYLEQLIENYVPG